MSTKIKICGLTQREDIEAVNRYKPDFGGFVLYCPKSKRNLQMKRARELLGWLSSEIKSVAVVVSPSAAQVQKIQEAGFDRIQIHGVLSDQVYQTLSIPIMRAVNVTAKEDLEKLDTREKIVGYVFDAKSPGSGKTFDWDILKDIPREGREIFLAGGINQDNVTEAIGRVKPDVIDLSSYVEWDDPDKPGKDPEKIQTMIRKVHHE